MGLPVCLEQVDGGEALGQWRVAGQRGGAVSDWRIGGVRGDCGGKPERRASPAERGEALSLRGEQESLVEADKLEGGRPLLGGGQSGGELQGVGGAQVVGPEQAARGLAQDIHRLARVVRHEARGFTVWMKIGASRATLEVPVKTPQLPVTA